ncbi:hypothetical protein N7537_010453 [Penicillium hordei]|uniref:Uncharacterized protein n=1 Tax=Penicillium hordei TaxID=40994 RepID=A0AAD6GYT8_9EURO|nr:uncharacterized protein N7537_010453 [Penicillium hordei]KAJ5593549.1 hypothetical protein N7537_010453 [Penicillium hordei]
MKRHWREKYSWKSSSSKGRPQAAAQEIAQQQIQQFTRIVPCQQAFNHGTGSHYIHVRGQRTAPRPPVEPAVQQASQIHAELDKMEALYQQH